MYNYQAGSLQVPESIQNKIWAKSKTNSISPAEELSLIYSFKNKKCKSSFDKLFYSHLKIVNKAALKFSKVKNELFFDLQSEGFKGLAHAINEIDPKKARLSTYAPYWIKYYIELFFTQNNFGNICIGKSSIEKKIFYYLRNLQKEKNEINDNDIIEIAKTNNVKPSLVKDIISFVTVCLIDNSNSKKSENFENTSPGNVLLNNLSYEMFINDNCNQKIHDNIDLSKNITVIKSWLSKINQRDRRIFEKKHFMEKTYNQIAVEENISFQRVSQIDKKNFNKLKKHMMDYAYAA